MWSLFIDSLCQTVRDEIDPSRVLFNCCCNLLETRYSLCAPIIFIYYAQIIACLVFNIILYTR